jgi:hypothetical protein
MSKNILLTEEQFHSFIKNVVMEGFSLDPYYYQDSKGNTVKRDRLMYRPNQNDQLKKTATNDKNFNKGLLTNEFRVNINGEMQRKLNNSITTINVKWGYDAYKGEILIMVKGNRNQPYYHRYLIPQKSEITRCTYNNENVIFRFSQPTNTSQNSYNKNGIIKIPVYNLLKMSVNSNRGNSYEKDDKLGVDTHGYMNTEFGNDIENKTFKLTKSGIKCTALYNADLEKSPQNSKGGYIFSPLKKSEKGKYNKSHGSTATNQNRAIEDEKTPNKNIIQDESLMVFFNKTAMLIANYIRQNNINTIICPPSSSPLNEDIINLIRKRLPNGNLLKTYTDLFVKTKNDNGKEIQIKKLTPSQRGEIIQKPEDFINFNFDKYNSKQIQNIVTNNNVLMFDDNISVGTTLDNMGLLLQKLKPSFIGAVVIANIPKRSDRNFGNTQTKQSLTHSNS